MHELLNLELRPPAPQPIISELTARPGEYSTLLACHKLYSILILLDRLRFISQNVLSVLRYLIVISRFSIIDLTDLLRNRVKQGIALLLCK